MKKTLFGFIIGVMATVVFEVCFLVGTGNLSFGAKSVDHNRQVVVDGCVVSNEDYIEYQGVGISINLVDEAELSVN